MVRLVRGTLLALIFATLSAHATPPAADIDAQDLAVMRTSLFANAHPDLRFRLSAIGSIDEGRVEEAFSDLLQAARFGDKPAQALIAEAYWLGSLEQPLDRPLAYAWMDLAAERGYPMLIVKREAYWEALNESERTAALTRGKAVYAEYGDAAALPRLDRQLRFARQEKTGTRTGASAGSKTYLANAGGEMIVTFLQRIRGQSIRPMVRGGQEVDFWEDKFWHLDDYLAWKAEAIDGDLTGAGKGRVEILPIKPERDRS